MAYCDLNKCAVFLFTLSTCVHCKAVKQLLNELDVQYNYLDVDLLKDDEQKLALEEISQYNPSQSFPTSLIGNRVIAGNAEADIKAAVAKIKRTVK